MILKKLPGILLLATFATSADLPDDKRIMAEMDIHLKLLGKEK